MDRFDLEQGIMKCWSILDDIDALYYRYGDGAPMTEDEMLNYLLGLKTIYQVKFEQLFGIFEELVHKEQIK